MESSPLLMLRTLVMLISLVAIPLAAVFGTSSWPQILEAVHRFRTQVAEALEPGSPAIEPLSLEPLTVGLAASPAARNQASPPSTVANVPAAAVLAAPLQPNNIPSSNILSAAPAGASAGVVRPPPFWRGADQETTSTVAAPPAADAGLPMPDRRATPAAFVSAAPASPALAVAEAAGGDPVESIQKRLQNLGALHYRLETAGPSGEWFRFQCKMGLESNPTYVRYFDATDVDAPRAMQRVLRDVEAWALNGQASQ